MNQAETVTARDAFGNRDFTVFWVAGLTSNIGSWMQNLAVPYVIFERTGSVTWVGVTALASLLPSVPTSPIGGLLADRYPRRVVLLVTQCLFAVVALGLWLEWLAGWRSPWALIAPVAVGSALSGINMASWQAFIYDLVPTRLLPPSIALNSAGFHLARAVGPAIAGWVLYRWGPSWTFLINAFSFLAVIGALLVLHPQVAPKPRVTGGLRQQTIDAGRYVWTTPALRTAFSVLAVMAFFGHPILALATPIGKEIFGAGSRGVGLLTAGFGIGAGLAVLLLPRLSRRFPRQRVVSGGLLVYSAFLLLLATSRTLAMMFALLIPFGTAYLAVVATLNTIIQTTTAEQLRGRVLAIYFAVFSVFYPIGAMIQSRLADWIGLRTTIGIFGVLLSMLYLWWRRRGGLTQHLTPAPVTVAP